MFVSNADLHLICYEQGAVTITERRRVSVRSSEAQVG